MVRAEGMTQTPQRTDNADRIRLGPNEVVIRLSADDTDGAVSICEYTAPPDGPSPPLHVHQETDEVLYVLDGDVECRVGDEIGTVGATETVWIPRGTAHTFSATGSRPAWLLLWYAPGGFEGYFEEMGAFLRTLPPGPPDMEAVGQKAAELSDVYDQMIVADE